MMGRWCVRFLAGMGAFALVALLAAVSAYAQNATGSISGVVKDASGGVITGATVTATNTDTGVSHSISTADDGAYRFPVMPVGNYEVKVTKDGFQTSDRKGLTLSVTQDMVIDVTLQVGSTGQTVTVTEEAPIVNTTSSSVGGLVPEASMNDLPLNGRNYMDLTLMQTGTNSVKSVGVSAGLAGDWISVNGAPPRSNTVLLDGASLTTMPGATASSISGTTLGLDGIREYKVVTNSFSAEYGMTMGSQVTMVSRSGANQFHGTAFDYLRNASLDARNTFDKPDVSNVNGCGTENLLAYACKRLPPYERNDFGTSFGGPIRKDKTFFFANFEQLNERKGLTTIDTVPPACLHTASPLVSPPSGCAGAGLTWNPTSWELMQQFGVPNLFQNGAALTSNNFTVPYIQPTRDDFGQMRIDQNFNSSDSMFVRYTIDDGYQNQGTTFPPSTFTPLNYYNQLVSRNQFTTASETHIFSSTLVNTFRASYSRTNLVANTPTVVPAGVPLTQEDFRQGGTSITGYTGISSDCCNPSHFTQNLFTFGDDVYWTHGNHAVKYGILINRFEPRAISHAFEDGSIGFNSIANFIAGNPTSIANEYQGVDANQYRNMRYTSYGFYGQDDYRVTSRLTLNLGLRYEFNTTPREIHNYDSSLRNITDDFGTVGPIMENKSYYNFGPRLGFAWDIFGNGKMSLRGGGGVFYDVGNIGSLVIQQLIGTPPYSGRTSVTSNSGLVTNGIGTAGLSGQAFAKWPTLDLIDPFTCTISICAGQTSTGVEGWIYDAYNHGIPPATALGVLEGRYLQTNSYTGGQPRLTTYNLTIERELPFNSGISVAWAGSRGNQIYRIIEGNPVIPDSITNGVPVYSAGDQRLNPYWNSIRNTAPIAYSWYDALQVVYTKRASHGLQLQANFTYSKLLDTTQGVLPNDGTGGSGSLGYDPFDQFLDKAPAVFNIPWKFNLNATYRIPQIGGTEGVVSKLVNGWWVGTITNWQDGYPFNVGEAGNRSLSYIDGSGAGDRPSWASGCNAGSAIVGTTAQWFNPTCFEVPALGTMGNVPRDALIGPTLSEVDLSINKDTKAKFLGEAGAVQFRAELFNVMNHANYGLPAASVASPTNSTCAPTNVCPIVASGGNNGTLVNETNGVGSITSTNGNTSRQIQVSLRLIF